MIFVGWFVNMVIVGGVASNKGRTVMPWVWYAFFLGPIALVHILVVATDTAAVERNAVKSGTMRKCPACAEIVKREAAICRFCRTALPDVPLSPLPTADVPSLAQRERATGYRAFAVVIAAVLLVILVAGAMSRPGASVAAYDQCVARGVAYFTEIGSFPSLSDGRDANTEAKARCGRISTAF